VALPAAMVTLTTPVVAPPLGVGSTVSAYCESAVTIDAAVM